MSKKCENQCENCPVRREWAEEVKEIGYDITFLGDAIAESQQNPKRAVSAFIDIAAQEGFLGLNWEEFVSAQKKMDFDPSQLRQLGGELLGKLHEQTDELQTESRELAEGCPGPVVTEHEDANTKTTIYTCGSPLFNETDGLEPSHIIRIPKE